MGEINKMSKAGDVHGLIGLLEAPKKRVRTKTALALAAFDDPMVVAALVQRVLGDDDPGVRGASARSLICKEKDGAARRGLIGVLQDESEPRGLRRDVVLALTTPPYDESIRAIEGVISRASSPETTFGILKTLEIAPTLHLWTDTWRDLLEGLVNATDQILFAIRFSETLGCVALNDRWLVGVDPRSKFTGLQNRYGLKIYVCPYEQSLPIDFRVEGGEYLAFLPDTPTMRFTEPDLGFGVLKKARPFLQWLNRNLAGDE